ncbi:MinD/ParA family protein [Paenibacillus marinisediminis]
MMDQAASLRNLMSRGMNKFEQDYSPPSEEARSTRIITVTSGKGGVGKSNFTLNFAILLQEAGYRTLIFDADIGMANIDVLIGAPSTLSLYHVLSGLKKLEDIVQIGPKGIHYIPGGSGFHDLLEMPAESLENFLLQLEGWSERYDVILFDTGAGLSKETLRFVTAAEETFVVTTPEPTAIADAYALIKVVHGMVPETRFRLVVNRVTDSREGDQTAERLTSVAKRFLQLDIPVLGYLLDDPIVMQAVKKQTPFSMLYPNSKIAMQLRQFVQIYMNQFNEKHEQYGEVRGMKQFFRKWMKSWR